MAKNTRLAQYILPSAGGLCVTYLYNIVDGIFVGQGVGHQALAAVNITVPFITTLVAISSLLRWAVRRSLRSGWDAGTKRAQTMRSCVHLL